MSNKKGLLAIRGAEKSLTMHTSCLFESLQIKEERGGKTAISCQGTSQEWWLDKTFPCLKRITSTHLKDEKYKETCIWQMRSPAKVLLQKESWRLHQTRACCDAAPTVKSIWTRGTNEPFQLWLLGYWPAQRESIGVNNSQCCRLIELLQDYKHGARELETKGDRWRGGSYSSLLERNGKDRCSHFRDPLSVH